jgi:hypothetical protein
LGWEFFLRAIFRHASEAFWVEIARKQKFWHMIRKSPSEVCFYDPKRFT